MTDGNKNAQINMGWKIKYLRERRLVRLSNVCLIELNCIQLNKCCISPAVSNAFKMNIYVNSDDLF